MTTKSNIESLDTNILMRLVLGDIPEQRQKALTLLSKPDTSFYVDDQAITELAYNLEKPAHKPRQIVANSIHYITHIPNIKASTELFHEVLHTYLHHPALSFNDCYLAAKSAANHAEPLWTFDRTLAHQSPTAKELR